MDRRLGGAFREAGELPVPAYRLHRKIMAAARQERERQAKQRDIDEDGRRWPGLANPPRRRRRQTP